MKNKKNKTAKKGGRPIKTKRPRDEELNASPADNTTNASSSSPGHESDSLDEHVGSRTRTRSGGNKKAALRSQSRTLVQNIDGKSSNQSTLMLVKQILFESDHVHVDAKVTHSELEGISPDKKNVEAQNDIKIEKQSSPTSNSLNIEKFTSDLLAQNPQTESSFQVASHCSNESLVHNTLPQREANVVCNNSANETTPTNENPTSSPTTLSACNKSSQSHDILSGARDPMIDLEGYKVKNEMMPLLKAIFKRYGDIARESTFSMESRSCLLEMVCTIYTRLEVSKLMQLTPLELDSMLGQIGDLQLVKVNVGWLRDRLNMIAKARKMYDGISTFEDLKARSAVVIEEKEKAVQICEEDLQACLAAATKLQERLQQEKDELAAAQTEINILFESLVHDLV